ncbi:hypothetical protein EZI54_06845 [Marinobacter halodurans]|uniref:Type IV pilus biogenesis protein PilP n=1 Tax=Marinobacter halodurans TaxID=2528979 RepID=A0ABY1ZP59_9GAMM|nr:hypothetical protein [Marinobacter halodurans]TBW57368.1 hypothetical protein EZI54_06845 [Marinobacter halodurans]
MKIQLFAAIALVALPLSGFAESEATGAVASANSTAGLVINDETIKGLQHTKEQMTLQAEIMELSNRIQKAQVDGQKIGKEPDPSEKDDANDKERSDITYYPPPQQQIQPRPVEGNQSESGDSDTKPKDSPDYQGLMDARIKRTFRRKGSDDREAVMILRGTTVPVAKGDHFGKWVVTTVESGVIRFKHQATDETLVVGF